MIVRRTLFLMLMLAICSTIGQANQLNPNTYLREEVSQSSQAEPDPLIEEGQQIAKTTLLSWILNLAAVGVFIIFVAAWAEPLLILMALLFLFGGIVGFVNGRKARRFLKENAAQLSKEKYQSLIQKVKVSRFFSVLSGLFTGAIVFLTIYLMFFAFWG